MSVEQPALRLREALDGLAFAAPVSYVYNPLDYAWAAHSEYLRRYASGRKRVLFLGMNPGPFGMVQTGVPFGEIAAVRDWMGIYAPIDQPARRHPKRLVQGSNVPGPRSAESACGVYSAITLERRTTSSPSRRS